MSESENRLKAAIQRLEKSASKIVNTRGYNKDASSLKILEEMIREQIINANTRSSTRTVR